MSLFNEILQNKVLIIAATAWLTAGVLKMFIELIVNKKLIVSRIIGAGGMPSPPTASCTTTIAKITASANVTLFNP